MAPRVKGRTAKTPSKGEKAKATGSKSSVSLKVVTTAAQAEKAGVTKVRDAARARDTKKQSSKDDVQGKSSAKGVNVASLKPKSSKNESTPPTPVKPTADKAVSKKPKQEKSPAVTSPEIAEKASAKAPSDKNSKSRTAIKATAAAQVKKQASATAATAAPKPKQKSSTPRIQAEPAPKPRPAKQPEPVKPQAPKDEQDAFAVQSLDIEKLATNLARVVENSGKALAAYLQPRETGQKKENPDGVVDLVKTLGHVAEYWLSDPQRSYQAQATIAKGYMDLWAATVKSMSGEAAPPVVTPSPADKRFKDPEWSSNPVFDFMKQFYLVTSNWAEDLVNQADLAPHLKHKASFYTKQITGALSPSNFAITNPEVLRETIKTNGENLVRGTEMLAEDITLGHGDLKIRQSDETPFEMGRNIAVSPGKVIFENDLMQLIQYEPSTAMAGRIPLLIVPPWINKFYILDLSPEKSFIKWAVDQGLTVFVISWVNPDARLAQKSFAEYVKEGPLAAMDVINEITGIKEVHTIGYCVGGTLMACTLGYMAEKGDKRIVSNTFFTTQVDFTHAGDLLVFADEENIASVERQMQETGYLEGSRMANAFNMLRSNDLIWPYVVNNYLKGKKPMPFDLLYWNADSTRMPAANHSFYLRHCYLNNDLSNGRMVIDNVRIDLKKVRTPIYNLAAREDHIAPARSVFVGSGFFGGDVTYVMSGSGHIAGVVNPPALKKYQFWTGGPVKGSFDDWVKNARETPGSWWPHWREWVRSHDGKEVKSLKPGAGPFKPIEDAPGRYVKVKS